MRTPCTLSTKPKLYHTVLLLVLPYLQVQQQNKQPAAAPKVRRMLGLQKNLRCIDRPHAVCAADQVIRS
jgi:hypothetical protein